MKQWFMVIDVARCENCNNCMLACKDEHVDNDWPGYAAPQPRLGQRWMKIECRERGQFPLIDVAYRPTPCMHCANPPCEAASNGAITRRGDGIVLIDPLKAKGQRNLVDACPYGAIEWNAELQLPQKCTLCAHLLDQGWKQTRCVQACPTGALKMEQITAEEMTARAQAQGLAVLHPDSGTQPHIYYANLHRFDRIFIAGSIAYEAGGVYDCAAGAKVRLSRNGASLGETVADAFGDFRFDGLEPGSETFNVSIEFNGVRQEVAVPSLEHSLNLGVLRCGTETASFSPA